MKKKLTALSRLVESFSGMKSAPNTPITGENVFTQTCGVHADGDKKGNLYFNRLLPERFGGERQYALGKTSGKASIEKNLAALGIEVDKEHLKLILKRVVALGDKKKQVTLSDLPYIVADVLGTPISHKIILKEYESTLSLGKKPYAQIVLSIEGVEFSASAYGDGQYDAFMSALKKSVCET